MNDSLCSMRFIICCSVIGSSKTRPTGQEPKNREVQLSSVCMSVCPHYALKLISQESAKIIALGAKALVVLVFFNAS